MIKLLIAVTVLAPLLAQAAQTVTVDPASWLTYVNIGLAGLGLLAFVKGWIVPGGTYKEALKREQDKEREVQALRTLITERIMPELSKGREDSERMIDLTRQFLDLVSRYQIQVAEARQPRTPTSPESSKGSNSSSKP